MSKLPDLTKTYTGNIETGTFYCSESEADHPELVNHVQRVEGGFALRLTPEQEIQVKNGPGRLTIKPRDRLNAEYDFVIENVT